MLFGFLAILSYFFYCNFWLWFTWTLCLFVAPKLTPVALCGSTFLHTICLAFFLSWCSTNRRSIKITCNNHALIHLQPFPNANLQARFVLYHPSSIFFSFSLPLCCSHFCVLVYFCGIPIDFLICASIKENLRCKFAFSPRPDVRISFRFSYLMYGCAQYFPLCHADSKKRSPVNLWPQFN